jgi:hypothetical protein
MQKKREKHFEPEQLEIMEKLKLEGEMKKKEHPETALTYCAEEC